MCMIMRKPAGAHGFNACELRVSHDQNGDGWGTMYAHEGRVHVNKGMGFAPLLSSLTTPKWSSRVVYVHQRKATMGDIDLHNAHPHPVFSVRDGDHFDLWMMHNGTVDLPLNTAGASDSWHLAKWFRKWLRQHSQRRWWDHPTLLPEALQVIGDSRVVLLYGSGREIILNRDVGLWLSDGWWYSKPSCLAPEAMAKCEAYLSGSHPQGLDHDNS